MVRIASTIELSLSESQLKNIKPLQKIAGDLKKILDIKNIHPITIKNLKERQIDELIPFQGTYP